MHTDDTIPFSTDNITLSGSFFVDRNYTQKHAHTLHQHKSVLELLYVCDGEGCYQVGNREYAVSEGDMIICNALTLHGETLSLKNTIQTYCIALSGVQLPQLPANCLVAAEHRPVISLTRFRDMISSILPHIHDMFLLKEYRMGQQLAVAVLMMTYQELQQQRENDSPLVQRNEMIIRKISRYLDEHYTEPLRMDDLSEEFHLSVSHLSHMFKRETGFSPKQYIVLRRIGEAQSLLTESDMPIGQIEEQLGFSSSCHLTATFKKYVGISPREYRKHFRDTDS